MNTLLNKNSTELEQLKRSINGELFGLKMFDIFCKLSLYIDELTEDERYKAQSRYKMFITILPSKNGGHYLFMNHFQEKAIEAQANFWELVRNENGWRKEHNQELINYNIDKVRFFLEK